MQLVILILGGLVFLLGAFGVVAPARFRKPFEDATSQARFIAAIVVRLGFGLLLWYAADQLRFPHVVRIIAVIAFVAAVGVLIMGRERLDRLVTWWLTRSDTLFRVSTGFAALFGAFLVYVAA